MPFSETSECVFSNTVHFVVSYLNKVFSDHFDWFVVKGFFCVFSDQYSSGLYNK